MSNHIVVLTATRHNTANFIQRISLFAIASVLSVFSFNLFAADRLLTLAEAQRFALARSQQLAAQDWSVRASREMAVAAGQLPDPVLKAGIDNLPMAGQDSWSLTRDFMTMRRIGVMQELTRTDKRQLRAQFYERTAEKSQTEKSAAIAAIQIDTATAWLDRFYAEQMAAVVAEQILLAKLEIQTAEAAYRAGRGSQADIFAARSAFVSVEDRLSEIDRRVLNAKIMLSRWTGEITHTGLDVLPAIDTIRLEPANLASSLLRHPQISILTRQSEIASTDAKLAQANLKADWTVEIGFQQRGPAYSNMLSIGVSLPLQWDQKQRQSRELSSKLALVEQAKAERDEMLRSHIATTQRLINEWQNGRERSARFQGELIPLATRRTEAVLAAYRGGKSSLAELLLARRNEVDVRLQTLQLQADTARLWAQLNFLFPSEINAGNSALIKDSQ